MNELFYPSEELSKNARIKNMDEYHALCKEAEDDYEGFWGRMANEKISWTKPFQTVLDESDAPFFKWFKEGELNVSEQCIDRHLADKRNQAAILFEGERGDTETITYGLLANRVNQFANLLKNQFGIVKGDRVVIYMPMIPEAAYAMLACARLGAIHSVVFGGFSSDAIRDRIIDAEAKIVITADGAYRRGKPYMLKPAVDSALEKGCPSIEKVLVVKRNHEAIHIDTDRDVIYNDIIDNESIFCEATQMNSEDPLFLLYTSGSTGKPKGVQHSSAGFILWAQMTMEWVFDVQHNDTFWCTADVGWITGHTYIVYGPLAMGATTIMYEGTPLYPDAGRLWKVIEKHKVNQFYTAPTAIRLLHKEGADEPKKYDLSSLKVLGTVGEPINHDAWNWYYNEVGAGKCPIVDTYWQTETGGHIISPIASATPIKPSSATFSLPGIMGEIIEAGGTKKEKNSQGMMCVTKPWPSMIRNIWGDPERFKKSYFGDASKDGKPVYFTGDGAIYDDDGYIVITGRMDDVINVSGHRMGTAEVEDAIGDYTPAGECAVVGRPHDLKGESIFVYVVMKDGQEERDYKKEINDLLREQIGAIAKADDIIAVPGLPKTRSGKIMRRILRSIAKGEAITQDTSTLEDPSIVTKIETAVKEA
jgi:acetyl-CoA synthetase